MNIRESTIEEYIQLMKEEHGLVVSEKDAKHQIFMFVNLYHQIVKPMPKENDTTLQKP